MSLTTYTYFVYIYNQPFPSTVTFKIFSFKIHGKTSRRGHSQNSHNWLVLYKVFLCLKKELFLKKERWQTLWIFVLEFPRQNTTKNQYIKIIHNLWHNILNSRLNNWIKSWHTKWKITNSKNQLSPCVFYEPNP